MSSSILRFRLKKMRINGTTTKKNKINDAISMFLPFAPERATQLVVDAFCEYVLYQRPNGMAQRQRRDWRDSSHYRAVSGKSRLRGAAEPLSDWSRC
jgi:hypothetical protein